jgi:predicted enzyme related to lactoylglutathione lyase
MAAMTTRTSPWPPGIPCWVDLATPDVDAAKAFYATVLGWSYTDAPPEFGGYTTAQMRDRNAAGIGPVQSPEQPSAWTLYFASDDADKTATSVTEHGGTVLFGPDNVGPLGRMFVAADPTGAAFGVWQHLQHIGAGIVSEAGALAWEDLRSADPDAARGFYTGVFGFETRPLSEEMPDYTTFHLAGDDAPLGGMGGMMGLTGLPSHWVVYFGVPDCDAGVVAAEQAGGVILSPSFQTPYGKMAAITDPAGASFWIAETDPASVPDRGD